MGGEVSVRGGLRPDHHSRSPHMWLQSSEPRCVHVSVLVFSMMILSGKAGVCCHSPTLFSLNPQLFLGKALGGRRQKLLVQLTSAWGASGRRASNWGTTRQPTGRVMPPLRADIPHIAPAGSQHAGRMQPNGRYEAGRPKPQALR